MDELDRSKVEQYLQLAKGTKGSALASLVIRATDEPGIYTYGELLSLPNVKELAIGEHAKVYELLKLFSYGSLSDLRANPSQFPPLSEGQLRKLRILTLVSIATCRRSLSYSDIMSAIELEGVRQLEDFLISECMYGGLIKGKLDQMNQCLHIEDAYPRDIPPEHVGQLIHTLGAWLERTQSTLTSVQSGITWLKDTSARAKSEKENKEQSLLEAREKVKEHLEASMPAHDPVAMEEDRSGGSGAMEEDPRPSSGRTTKRRR